MPNFEAVPASALFTSNAADRRNGLTGEYFNIMQFRWQAAPPARTDLSELGQDGRRGSAASEAAVHARRSARSISTGGMARRAPDMNDDDFGVRWTGYLAAPVTGTYQLGAIGMNAFELYLDGKPIVNFNNIHERSYRYEQVKLEAGQALRDPPRLSRVPQRCRYPAGLVAPRRSRRALERSRSRGQSRRCRGARARPLAAPRRRGDESSRGRILRRRPRLAGHPARAAGS